MRHPRAHGVEGLIDRDGVEPRWSAVEILAVLWVTEGRSGLSSSLEAAMTYRA